MNKAVSENLFVIFKREWLKSKYDTIIKLKKDVAEFVHNYNHFRIYSTLNYQSPIEFRLSNYDRIKCLPITWQFRSMQAVKRDRIITEGKCKIKEANDVTMLYSL
jgi:hypothetical protein